LIGFLKQGFTAEKLALTLALGFSIGVIPFIGINTVLLALLAIIFRLNLVAIQLVNYFFFFLQMALYIPFLQIGSLIFHGPEIPYSAKQLIAMLKANWIDTITNIWYINSLGLVVWFIAAIPIGIAIYYISLPVFRKYEKSLIID
jgi:uncharacterized protein (DUF2062 family)